jgi:hypothetical protein
MRGARFRTRHLVFLACLPLLAGLARRCEAADPLATIRTFCRADGEGVRLQPRTWPEIAPLVSWRLEPAWDRVVLIQGYEIGPPRVRDERVEVVVTYTVLSEVRGDRVMKEERLERKTYSISLDEPSGSWLIDGPPPAPHLFASQFDAEGIRSSIEPGAPGYQSASVLVWMLLRGAGWDVPYLDTLALGTGPGWTNVESAEPGDLVVYQDGETPYQVGLLEAEDTVVSATLNGGIRRTPVAAFPGQVRYRRLAAKKPPEPTAAADHPP